MVVDSVWEERPLRGPLGSCSGFDRSSANFVQRVMPELVSTRWQEEREQLTGSSVGITLLEGQAWSMLPELRTVSAPVKGASLVTSGERLSIGSLGSAVS